MKESAKKVVFFVEFDDDHLTFLSVKYVKKNIPDRKNE